MPFTKKNGQRDYKRELQWEHTQKPNRVKDRAARNTARREMGVKVGDPRQVDHIKPLVDGGSKTAKKNLRIVSARVNLRKEAQRKQGKK